MSPSLVQNFNAAPFSPANAESKARANGDTANLFELEHGAPNQVGGGYFEVDVAQLKAQQDNFISKQAETANDYVARLLNSSRQEKPFVLCDSQERSTLAAHFNWSRVELEVKGDRVLLALVAEPGSGTSLIAKDSSRRSVVKFDITSDLGKGFETPQKVYAEIVKKFLEDRRDGTQSEESFCRSSLAQHLIGGERFVPQSEVAEVDRFVAEMTNLKINNQFNSVNFRLNGVVNDCLIESVQLRINTRPNEKTVWNRCSLDKANLSGSRLGTAIFNDCNVSQLVKINGLPEVVKIGNEILDVGLANELQINGGEFRAEMIGLTINKLKVSSVENADRRGVRGMLTSAQKKIGDIEAQIGGMVLTHKRSIDYINGTKHKVCNEYTPARKLLHSGSIAALAENLNTFERDLNIKYLDGSSFDRDKDNKTILGEDKGFRFQLAADAGANPAKFIIEEAKEPWWDKKTDGLPTHVDIIRQHEDGSKEVLQHGIDTGLAAMILKTEKLRNKVLFGGEQVANALLVGPGDQKQLLGEPLATPAAEEIKKNGKALLNVTPEVAKAPDNEVKDGAVEPVGGDAANDPATSLVVSAPKAEIQVEKKEAVGIAATPEAETLSANNSVQFEVKKVDEEKNIELTRVADTEKEQTEPGENVTTNVAVEEEKTGTVMFNNSEHVATPVVVAGGLTDDVSVAEVKKPEVAPASENETANFSVLPAQQQEASAQQSADEEVETFIKELSTINVPTAQRKKEPTLDEIVAFQNRTVATIINISYRSEEPEALHRLVEFAEQEIENLPFYPGSKDTSQIDELIVAANSLENSEVPGRVIELLSEAASTWKTFDEVKKSPTVDNYEMVRLQKKGGDLIDELLTLCAARGHLMDGKGSE